MLCFLSQPFIHTQSLFVLSFQEETDRDILSIMNSWVFQKGYPVITLTHVAGDVIAAKQSYFISSNYDESSSVFSEELSPRWWIPLNYQTNSDSGHTSVDMGLNLEIEIPFNLTGDLPWFKVCIDTLFSCCSLSCTT